MEAYELERTLLYSGKTHGIEQKQREKLERKELRALEARAAAEEEKALAEDGYSVVPPGKKARATRQRKRAAAPTPLKSESTDIETEGGG
jgi:hypothetical protein